MTRNYDEYKTRAIRMLDKADEWQGKAFLVVTTGYVDELDEEGNPVGEPVCQARCMTSDPRLLCHLIDVIYAAYPQAFGDRFTEEGEPEEDEEGEE
jgi:hypothetical protein